MASNHWLHLFFILYFCIISLFNFCQSCYEQEKPINFVGQILSTSWTHRPNGNYSKKDAECDFGTKISFWNASHSQIINGSLRIKMDANKLSNGGLGMHSPLPSGEEYEMSYDLKFDKNFQWSRGGKIGFGFFIGISHTGGNAGWDGTGGSFRIMWGSKIKRGNDSTTITNKNAEPYLIPYIYYKNQPEEGGDHYNATKFSNLKTDTWYHIYMYIKSNTGENKNGGIKVKINNETLINKNIRWTTSNDDIKRLINAFCFMTFRGGSKWYWTSPNNDYIYYNNLVITKLS